MVCGAGSIARTDQERTSRARGSCPHLSLEDPRLASQQRGLSPSLLRKHLAASFLSLFENRSRRGEEADRGSRKWPK